MTKDKNSRYNRYPVGGPGEAYQQQGLTTMLVCGNSMKPFFRAGDMVAVRSVSPETIRRGSVILFSAQPDGPRIMHRVVKIFHENGARRFLCQGDNRFNPDGWIEQEQVLGKIAGRFDNRRLKPVRRYQEYMGLVLPRWYRTVKRAVKKTVTAARPFLSPWSRTILVLDHRGRCRTLVVTGRRNLRFR